jgi:hypothetical protein
MAHARFLGISDPKTAFARLRPYRNELLRMAHSCRPFGSDYLIMDAAIKALDTASYHFTREPDFFALKPEQSKYRPPPE